MATSRVVVRRPRRIVGWRTVDDRRLFRSLADAFDHAGSLGEDDIAKRVHKHLDPFVTETKSEHESGR